MGEAWGRGEDITRQPFSHDSGKELWLMLGEAWPDVASAEHARVTAMHGYDFAWVGQRNTWLAEASLAFTNVFAFRPPDNQIPALCCRRAELPPGYDLPAIKTGLYISPDYVGELDRLLAELAECRPNLIVAAGDVACWALLRTTNISSLRGTVMPGSIAAGYGAAKVLPTYHPASLLYEGAWRWRPIIVADLMKALVESKRPDISRPSRRVLFDPTINEVCTFAAGILLRRPPLISVDTETSLGLIDTISIASASNDALVCQVGPHRERIGQRYVTVWPRRDGADVVHYWSRSEEGEFWRLIAAVLESDVPKIFQNGLYDLQYLLRAGIRPQALREDLMLEHHALWPEMQKGLGFQGSIWTNEPAWKLMRRHRADSEKRDE